MSSRTYVGRSRSFLVELPVSAADESPYDLDRSQSEANVRESYSDLRTRWGVDVSEEDSSELPGQGISKGATSPSGTLNDLQSVSELRSKGENRRFLDEVGYLCEGLEHAGNIELRRARHATWR